MSNSRYLGTRSTIVTLLSEPLKSFFCSFSQRKTRSQKMEEYNSDDESSKLTTQMYLFTITNFQSISNRGSTVANSHTVLREDWYSPN